MRIPNAVAVAGVASVLGCLAVACTPFQHPPRIVDPGGGNWAGEGRPRTQQNDALSIGMETTLCLDKPGSVRLTGVTPVDGLGLRVTGFGLRPNQNWKPTQGTPGAFLGMESAPLRHFGFSGRTVDAVCDPKTGAGYELAVRVTKTVAGPARAAGWKVAYVSNGHAETVTVPFGVNLCPDEKIEPSRCPDPDMSRY